MVSKILVVEDEEPIAEVVRSYLEREGFQVAVAADGLAALDQARKLQPDLIILDIMLPGMDGLEVLRRLRQESQVYVLMLTARSEEVDKIVGLSVGADDYVTKPFSPRELVARVKAILRRGRGAESKEQALSFRHVRIDPVRRQAWVNGATVSLTQLEFDLLNALASYPGMVFSRERLLERVWGYDFYGDDRVVDVHIGILRKKLGDDSASPRLIKTVRGVGYKFEDEPV
ncbi:MAG: response regulator transcription factor [Chloroflexi bacterium]|nr:response regulator transcription factor [Chloroflexota bacterium]